MSIINPTFVQAVAEGLGIKPTDEASKNLASDVENKIKEIIQESTKFARHSKRTHIIPEDINNAFRLKNVQPIYGLSNSSDPAQFCKVPGHPGFSYMEDPLIPVEHIINPKSLPPIPWETGIRIHWLAVNGKQPAIPANIPVLPRDSITPSEQSRAQKKQRIQPPQIHEIIEATHQRHLEQQQQQQQGLPTAPPPPPPPTEDTANEKLFRLPLRHLVSQELHTYYSRITTVLKTTQQIPSKEYSAVLESLREDAGLSSLAPYLCKFFADEIAKQIQSAPQLILLLRAVASTAANTHLDLGANLHVLVPAVLICLLGSYSGIKAKASSGDDSSLSSDHWEMRDHAARAVANLCKRYPEAAPRIQRELIEALRSISPHTTSTSTSAPTKDGIGSLYTVYGAVIGIYEQGPYAVRSFLLPNLIPCMNALHEDLQGKRGREIKECALKVRGALLRAAGECVYQSTAFTSRSYTERAGRRHAKNALLNVPREKAEEIVAKRKADAEDQGRKKGPAAGKKRGGGGGRKRGRGKKTSGDRMVVDEQHDVDIDITMPSVPSAITTATDDDNNGGKKTKTRERMNVFGAEADEEKDATVLEEEERRAKRSLQSIPVYPVGEGHAPGTGDEDEEHMHAAEILADAWRRDFSVELMKKAMVEIFGNEVIQLYECGAGGSGVETKEGKNMHGGGVIV